MLAGAQQLAAISETLVLFVDALKLARLRTEVVQLFQLVVQQLGAGAALLALLLMLGQLAAAVVPQAIVLCHLLEQGIFTGIAIEQGFLVIGFGQQLVGVLAVDLNKKLAQLTQLGERHRRAVDKAAGAAVAADDAAQQALTAIFKLVLFQPALGSRGVFQGKAGAEIGACGVGANHVGFRAPAKAEPKGINGNGFTRAGFASNGGHAAVKINFQLANNCKITDGQLCQHSRFSCMKNHNCVFVQYKQVLYPVKHPPSISEQFF